MDKYSKPKQLIKKLPGASKLNDTFRRMQFAGSAAYWEERYSSGGNSGDGSYGPLAEYKAWIINEEIRRSQATRVLELGCGDGAQLQLAEYPEYVGLDVSPSAIELCLKKFNSDASKSFFLYDPNHFHDNLRVFQADISLSLDVVYHLIEDDTFALHIRHLFDVANRKVIIYSSDREEIEVGSAHVRHRSVSSWIANNEPRAVLTQRLSNPFDDPSKEDYSHASFLIYDKLGI